MSSETLLYSEPGSANGRVRTKLQLRSMEHETKIFLVICLAHLPLGILLYNIGAAAILHPLAVLAIGSYWALNKRYRIDRVALAAGYLIGCEVLWRMAQIPVFWEIGKYGTVMLMAMALIARHRTQMPKLAIVYFLALIPACGLTLLQFDPGDARSHLSFTMSGPLLLVTSCWFFSHVQTTEKGLRSILFSVMIPLISVACVTLFYVVSSEEIEFGTESNFQTSGGFGPNQVSAMLGLGVFLAASCVVLFTKNRKLRFILGFAGVFLAAQTVLTFSRGGIYNAVGGLLVLILLHFRDFREGLKRVVPVAALCILFFVFIFPQLNDFTGGKLEERFEDTGTTNRTEIIESDLAIFSENPILGIGVGASKEQRKRFLQFSAASHTEFSRMLSEHGSFGVIALLALVAIAVSNFRRQRTTLGKALVAGVLVWGTLFMFNAGLRLGAPAFMWGLTFISLVGARNLRVRRVKRSMSLGVSEQPPTGTAHRKRIVSGRQI